MLKSKKGYVNKGTRSYRLGSPFVKLKKVKGKLPRSEFGLYEIKYFVPQEGQVMVTLTASGPTEALRKARELLTTNVFSESEEVSVTLVKRWK